MDQVNTFRSNLSTPWGSIQQCYTIAEGVVQIDTARHGGLWLSPERVAQLPPEYEPFLKNKQWAEEDEDAPLALQYLGLLSLIEDDLTLDITEIDIVIGATTRKSYYGSLFHGGPIVEAYKRQTGDDCGEMICSGDTISPRPGGFKLANLCEKAQAFMKASDAGETVKPTTVTLSPFRIPLPQKFTHILANGETHIQKVCGGVAEMLINGDEKAITDHIGFTNFCYPKLAETVRIVHNESDTIIYKRK